MDEYMNRIRKLLEGDLAPRALLMGGAAILTIVVLSDLAGARDRAPELRETMRTIQAEQDGAVTVPSVYSVPRDLASEAMLAARAQDVPEEIVIAEADMPEEAVAEVTEESVEEVVEAARAADAVEEVVELTEEATEEATEEVAEVATMEEEAQDTAEADVSEEAAEEMAEAPAAEDAVEELAEAEVADAATADMAAASADMGDLSLLAGADIDNGQRVWRQCGACHVYDAEQNRGGPHLVNIVGRDIGSAEGWRYSRALSEHGGVWTVEGLLQWLENPDAYIPGNQMAFRGLRNEQDRIDILGFLNANRAD